MLLLKMRIMDFCSFIITLTVCTVSCCVMATNFNKAKDEVPNPRGRISDRQLVVSCPMTPIHLLLPHPTDCGKFFSCDAGIAHLKACQQGLHFNEKLQICYYPVNAGCDIAFTQAPQGKIGEGISNDLCPTEKTKFPVLKPHSSDCGKFYICDGGTPYLKVCQPGLHFNTKTQTCDYPRNAGCESNIIAEKPRGKDLGDDSYLQCPDVHGKNPILLPHKTDCGKFYICDKGVPYLKVCQDGLHFNPKVQACDYPINVGCGPDQSKDPSGEMGNIGVCSTSQNSILVPHPNDCSKFFMCDRGQSYAQKCPSGLHFNVGIHACDYPENAQCEKDQSNKDSKGRMGNIGVCSKSKNGILLPHPSDCSKFLMCNKGQSYVQKCPSGLHFNAGIYACDYPENAQCEKAESAFHSAGVSSPYCPTIEGKTPVFYRHPTNCSIYYMCSNGLAYKFECPARLHFNLRLRICDYEWVARCPTGKSSDKGIH